MSNDYMDGLFDFDGDGRADAGEEIMAYKIFEDCTRSSEPVQYPHTSGAKKMDGLVVFMIVIIAYAILNTVCDWLY